MSTVSSKPSANEQSDKYFLFDFLDTCKLSRAERSYYEKHYTSFANKQETLASWSKIIKFIHE